MESLGPVIPLKRRGKLKEIIRGFKRGLVWCAVILCGIVVVTIIKVATEWWEEEIEGYE